MLHPIPTLGPVGNAAPCAPKLLLHIFLLSDPHPSTFPGTGADQSPRVPTLLLLWANLAILETLI